MSEPFTDECVYCGSLEVMDDAWWCWRKACWKAYERECVMEDWRETHRPLTRHKAQVDLSRTGASVWGHAYGEMIDAAELLTKGA